MADLKNIHNTIRLNRLDYCHYTLARFINDTVPESSELCLWLCVLVNLEIDKGNVCLDIDRLAQLSREYGWKTLPSDSDLRAHIQNSQVIGTADQSKPLIVDQHKLYLNRNFHQEKNIADTLLQKASQGQSLQAGTVDAINTLFVTQEALDYQKLAAIVSSLNRLCIISGGPGTGKTWTVSKILALLLKLQPGLTIKLAAPTGKAAARMSESILALSANLNVEQSIKEQMPSQAQTLHRLLAIHRFTHRPRFNRKHRLDCDVLVLDEASMIDQSMMALVCEALPDHGKLILLGDKDQLSSVEAGSVFADLCGGLRFSQFTTAQQELCRRHWDMSLALYDGDFALADNVVVLQKSHRFNDQSKIGQLAKAIKNGDSDSCIQLLKQGGQDNEVSWSQPLETEMTQFIRQLAAKQPLGMMQAGNIGQAFELFHQHQILAAVWQGPYGVDNINATLESRLKASQGLSAETTLYAGKPVMMTSNAYAYGIHNGDIGIIWPDQSNNLKVWFEQGRDEYQVLSLAQCPAFKSAYAMTVHKSQGSEFRQVLVVLPAVQNPVCTRELLYTGVTRAAEAVEIWAGEDMIKNTIEQKTRRESGLMQRLSGPFNDG